MHYAFVDVYMYEKSLATKLRKNIMNKCQQQDMLQDTLNPHTPTSSSTTCFSQNLPNMFTLTLYVSSPLSLKALKDVRDVSICWLLFESNLNEWLELLLDQTHIYKTLLLLIIAGQCIWSSM